MCIPGMKIREVMASHIQAGENQLSGSGNRASVRDTIKVMAVQASVCDRAGTEQKNFEWIRAVYRAYELLCRSFPLDQERGLGGFLLFAGELPEQREQSTADAMVVAANIAGVATLVAAPEAAVQRRAMRDALVDFVVHSMEEALRILKNEIRQRRAVSVAVAVSGEYLAEEMLKRGVQPEAIPDFALPGPHSPVHALLDRAMQLRASGGEDASETTFVLWKRESCCSSQKSVEETAALELATDPVRQRWLRLAPRYLGRAAHRAMGVGLSEREASLWRQRVLSASARVAGQSVESARESGQSESCLR